MFCSNLKKARKKAVNESYTSSEEICGRGKRKKIKRTQDSSESDNQSHSESSESDSSGGPPSLPSNFVSKTPDNMESQTYEKEPEARPEVSPALKDTEIPLSPVVAPLGRSGIQTQIGTPTTLAHNLGHSPVQTPRVRRSEPTLGEVRDLCFSTNQLVKDINSRLEKLENQQNLNGISNDQSNNLEEIQTHLPLKNVSDIKEFENFLLSDKEFFNTFKQLLTQIGGRNVKENLHRCLRAVFTNECANSCSWLGHRNNFRVCDLKVTTAIKSIMMESYKDLKLREFETLYSEWLRLSGLRMKRQK